MILTTTPSIEGKTIKEYRGIVTGEAILGANIFRDLFATVRDIVGGRSAAYEKELGEARRVAFEELQAEAQRIGADAVVGIDLDYEVVGITGPELVSPVPKVASVRPLDVSRSDSPGGCVHPLVDSVSKACLTL